MAYRLRYQWWVDWVPPGMGQLTNQPNALGAGPTPGLAPAGNAQTLSGFDSNSASGAIAGTTNTLNTSTFLAADITTLTSAAQQDLINQLTANQTRIQNFSTGQG